MVMALTGCRSHKVTTSGLGKEEMAAAKVRYEAVFARNFDYEYLQAKMKYSLDGSKALSGKLNVEHGKRLCLTVTVMGIEIARIEADQQTVMIYDKFDKVYAKASIAEVVAKLGLESEARLEALEALLLGRVFVPGRGLAASSDFEKLVWYPLENKELQADFVTEKYQLSYVMSPENYLVATQVKVPTKQSTFVWEYASPIEVEGGWMPTDETLSVAGGGRNMSANLTISNPVVSKKGWKSFEPGSNYREVTFAELFEIVKKIKN